jgi:hypothetical protein
LISGISRLGVAVAHQRSPMKAGRKVFVHCVKAVGARRGASHMHVHMHTRTHARTHTQHTHAQKQQIPRLLSLFQPSERLVWA